MLSLCINHVATVANPFALVYSISWLNFLKFVRFSSHMKKTMKLGLLHKNVNTSGHREGNLMALTAVYQFEL